MQKPVFMRRTRFDHTIVNRTLSEPGVGGRRVHRAWLLEVPFWSGLIWGVVFRIRTARMYSEC